MFRQIIRISIGSNPVPFFADLFLYYNESRWIWQLKKSDIRPAKRFANAFRFMDNLTATNDREEFERSCKDFYPPELELKYVYMSPILQL